MTGRLLAALVGITIGNHIRAARSRRLVDIGYRDGHHTGRITGYHLGVRDGVREAEARFLGADRPPSAGMRRIVSTVTEKTAPGTAGGAAHAEPTGTPTIFGVPVVVDDRLSPGQIGIIPDSPIPRAIAQAYNCTAPDKTSCVNPSRCVDTGRCTWETWAQVDPHRPGSV